MSKSDGMFRADGANSNLSPIIQSKQQVRSNSSPSTRPVINNKRTGNDFLLWDIFKPETFLQGESNTIGGDHISAMNTLGSSFTGSATPTSMISPTNNSDNKSGKKISSQFEVQSRTAPNSHRVKVINKVKSSVSKHSNAGRKKRRRRHFSCATCRKLKTKCIIQPGALCCDRCSRLGQKCVMPKEAFAKNSNLKLQSSNAIPSGSVIPNGKTSKPDIEIGSGIGEVQSKVDSLDSKMNTLMDMMDTLLDNRSMEAEHSNMESLGKNHVEDSSCNIMERYNGMAPLNAINKIHSCIFNGSSMGKDIFQQVLQQFIEFYSLNESVCLQLSRKFLETAHYWIVPGGISEIDREYVLRHPMNTCVYVTLELGFKDEHVSAKDETLLYSITRKLAANTSLSLPLSDHEIEALLYITIYGLSRRPQQRRKSANESRTKNHIGTFDEFDGWLLSSECFNHCIISLDLLNIQRRVSEDIFNDDDLFHLRIFNAACCCHYQYCVGYSRPSVIKRSYVDIHRLILQYPMATIGDAIKVAELELFQRVAVDIREVPSDNIEIRTIIMDSNPTKIVEFLDLSDWFRNWKRIISKDVTGALYLSFLFAKLSLTRQFLVNGKEMKSEDRQVAYNSTIRCAFDTINHLLQLPKDSIKGCPSFLLCEVVYACMTLFDYLKFMKDIERNMTISIISKVYWHLNKAGETTNLATDTIAKLIYKLVEMASNHQEIKYKKRPSFVGSGSITAQYMNRGHSTHRNTQQQTHVSPEDLPVSVRKHTHSPSSCQTLSETSTGDSNLGDQTESESKEDPREYERQSSPTIDQPTLASFSSISSTPKGAGTESHFQLPDVSNFKNFEEFFSDIFNDNPF